MKNLIYGYFILGLKNRADLLNFLQNVVENGTIFNCYVRPTRLMTGQHQLWLIKHPKMCIGTCGEYYYGQLLEKARFRAPKTGKYRDFTLGLIL